MIKISTEQYLKLKKELPLKYGDSFSNSEPSELCYEYRMETGFWLDFGKSRLILASTTKDDAGQLVHNYYIYINKESLGIDEDEPSEESNQRAKIVIQEINSLIATNFTFEELK